MLQRNSACKARAEYSVLDGGPVIREQPVHRVGFRDNDALKRAGAGNVNDKATVVLGKSWECVS